MLLNQHLFSIRAGQPPDPLLSIIRKIGALVKKFFEKVC